MNKKGFTLVELLATIVIVALIASIAVFSVRGVIGSSKDSVFRETAVSMLKTVKQELMMYNMANEGYYTFTDEVFDKKDLTSPYDGTYHIADKENSFCNGTGEVKIGANVCKKVTELICRADITESYVHVVKVNGKIIFEICLTDGNKFINEADENSVLDSSTEINDRPILITCPSTPADVEYTGGVIETGLGCPAGSIASGNNSGINAGTYNFTCTATKGYEFNGGCSINWHITKKAVTVEAPVVVSQTLTYSGSQQELLTSAGNCSSGGTMYWYTANPTTTNTPPTFSTTSGWTTTAPTTYKGTNAGTYNIWYYCKADSTNYSGADINTVKSVSKTINKLAATLTCDNKTYNGSIQDLYSSTTGCTNITNGSQIGVGTWTLTCEVDANHSAPSTCTGTISPKALTITAVDQSIDYGDSITTGVEQVTVEGLVTGDSLTAITLTASTTDPTTTGTITPSSATTTNGIGNYDVTYNTGNLTIIRTTVTCANKTYLPKNSDTCAQCTANHYCSGGEYLVFNSSDQGIKSCDTASGYSSPSGSGSIGKCCKEEQYCDGDKIGDYCYTASGKKDWAWTLSSGTTCKRGSSVNCNCKVGCVVGTTEYKPAGSYCDCRAKKDFSYETTCQS